MPGKIKVKILAGRNLPVMDRSGDTTDAYVELKFGNITYKTDVCRKSLNPQWNSEWYRFEVDDAELQDEPLQIRLMDHDTYSANDAIGKVYVNLNPLLLPGVLPSTKNIWTVEAAMNTSASSQGSVMTGWIPVYDTMHGIRGEVNIIIKVELFSDFNKFRQSSCGVQFFYSPNIPYGYHAQMIHGFVEELVVSDDPEYKWIDKIRTPRASNEARQTLFFKLSGEVQRKIGLKALDLGGNAVIGYLQNFDLEGESGIVARGIGTAVTLVKLHDVLGFPCDSANIEEIAFALPARTKAQMERFEAEDSVPLVPISVPIRAPASYPARVPMKPVDKTRFPLHAWSVSSLACIEHAAGSPGTPGRRGKCAKRIPFFRSVTSSTASLRAFNGSDLSPSKYLIDETMRSLRTMLISADDNKRESPKCRLSKQIRDLRDKFDSVGEENRPVVETGRDSSVAPIGPFAVSSRDPKRAARNFKETRTTGKVMAALLIGSIRGMPLKDIENTKRTAPVSSSNELFNDEETRTHYEQEDLHDPENVDGNIKAEEQLRQDVSSSVSETGMSSIADDDDDDDDNDNNDNDDDDDDDDDDSSPSDDSLDDDTTSYNILDDSRYSLDGNLLAAEESSNFRGRMVRSSTEGSTLRINVDAANYRLSPPSNLARTGNARLRNDEIPIITVDAHESTDSDASIDAPALPSDNENRSNCLISDIYSEFIPRNGRLELLKTPSASETEDRASVDEEERSVVSAAGVAFDSSREMTDTGVSYEEIRPKTNIERQSRMRDLIKLIDTKLMVRGDVHHVKRTVSLTNRRKKREKTRKSSISENSHERFSSSHGTSVRRYRKRRHGGGDISFRVPRARSIPNYLSSEERPNVSLRAISYSCSSSLVNLTDYHYHTRVSPCSKRATAVVPIIAIDRRSDATEVSKKSYENNNNDKANVVVVPSNYANDVNRVKPINANHLTFRKSSAMIDTKIIATRKCISVCNLDEALCHIDLTEPTNTANMTYNTCVPRPAPDLRQQDEATSSVSPSCPLPAVPSVATRVSQSPATRGLANVPLHRRSSDSDLSVTPKGNSLGSSDRSMAGPLRTLAAVVRPMNQDTLEMLEYPFITMQHYPPGFILHIGGLVSSRSVKLLERISNLEEPEGRDAWWTEIRMEVRSHARALACNVVIGYKEETSICDDVCVLSASGTAAVINFHNSTQEPDGVVLNKLQQSAVVEADRERNQQKSMATKIEKTDAETPVAIHSERQYGRMCRHLSESNDHEVSCGQSQRCNLCHLPYSESSVPFRVNVSKCAICKRARVPDVMFTTIEVPANVPTTGRGCFIQATVCKNKKDLRGELNAKEISDCLPFLEYELHSLLLNKLKVKGMNAIFGLRLQVSVGERLIIGMAVGTAVYLTALPPPTIPQIASGNSWHNDEQLAEIQRSIVETVKKNREFYHLKLIGVNDVENGRVASDTDESDEDLPELDLGLGTRDACVLEVDDIEDMDRISSLMDDRPPVDFHVVNTQTIPGLEDLEIVRNLQMFTQVSRAKIPTGQSASMPSKYFARLLQSLYFKLRRMVPCALCDMQFKVALPEQDEIQLTVVGMALGLGDPLKTNKYKRKAVRRSLSKDQVRKSDDSDMIFSLDEDHLENNSASDSTIRTFVGNLATLSGTLTQKPRPRSPLRSKTFSTHRRKHVPLKARYGVDITPLSYLPGGRIERYQGNLNFFFIRESTSIRENGGLSGFTHSFVMEVLAIVRAHITALGGNAMVAFFMTQCVLLHSPHKNQGQCLINVGGDVVTVSYYADEKHNAASNC